VASEAPLERKYSSCRQLGWLRRQIRPSRQQTDDKYKNKLKIATNIKTEDWNRIISGLKTESWTVDSKYNEFDAGIDFDFLVLKKNNEEIIFGWDNWVEGEIKCSDRLMNELSTKFKMDFTFGQPTNLKQSVIWLTKIQNWKNKIRTRT
jgi:hypothetical protein